ncbi:hypothetical protein M0804_004885 [Polistes exclamans]|nr:hypothetical protein M0804_004885 [Polistes exclamans]
MTAGITGTSDLKGHPSFGKAVFLLHVQYYHNIVQGIVRREIVAIGDGDAAGGCVENIGRSQETYSNTELRTPALSIYSTTGGLQIGGIRVSFEVSLKRGKTQRVEITPIDPS